jgi:hypothetical protein
MTSVGDDAEVAAREENARLRRELEGLLQSQDTAKDRARVHTLFQNSSFLFGGGAAHLTAD